MYNLYYDLIKQCIDDGSLNIKIIQDGEGDDECRQIQFPLKASNKLTIYNKPMLVVAHYLVIPKIVSDDAKDFYQYVIVAKEVPGSGQPRKFLFRFDAENKSIINSGKLALTDAQHLNAYGLPVVAQILASLQNKKQSRLEDDAPFREQFKDEDPNAYAQYLQTEMERREEKKRKQKLQPQEAPALQPPPAPKIKAISLSSDRINFDFSYKNDDDDDDDVPVQRSRSVGNMGHSTSRPTMHLEFNNIPTGQEQEDLELQRAIALSLLESHPTQEKLIQPQEAVHSANAENEEDRLLQEAIALSLTTQSNESSLVINPFQSAWQDYEKREEDSSVSQGATNAAKKVQKK